MHLLQHKDRGCNTFNFHCTRGLALNNRFMKSCYLLLFWLCAFSLQAQTTLVDFESDEEHLLIQFGGAEGSVVTDPTDASNTVGQVIKTAGAEIWAGVIPAVTAREDQSLPGAILFNEDNTTLTMRTWSPAAGVLVKLKVENAADPTVSVEAELRTTVAGQWETLTFDMRNQSEGTAELNFASTYNKAAVFFDFGVSPQVPSTYYFDDIVFSGDIDGGNGGGGGGGSDAGLTFPIDFENDEITYSLISFGGANATVATDPLDADNTVGQLIKTAGAEIWAGAVVTSEGAEMQGLAMPIDFSQGTVFTMRVFSPKEGAVVRLKAENTADGGIAVQTDATTTVAGEWETLTFDLANPSEGDPINMDAVYNKMAVFFDFFVSPTTDDTYYFDDIVFNGEGGGNGGGGMEEDSLVTFPITFENDAIDYTLIGFGGATGTIIDDATDPGNRVGQVVKAAGAEIWAGVVVTSATAPSQSLGEPFDFSQGTIFTMRVWSPKVGAVIRFKAENAADGGISVTTDATTTVADQWETLTFDLANQTEGEPINMDAVYDKLAVFFDFFVSPTTDDEYFFDDIIFTGEGGGNGGGGMDGDSLLTFPITFEDDGIEYSLVGFGGATASVVTDPTDAANTVGQLVKMTGAEIWAGTVVTSATAPAQRLAEAIDFSEGTVFTMRVWSPKAGAVVRFKAENAADGAIAVQTDATTTVAGEWETLTFDLANPSEGAGIDMAATYDKIAVFFDFFVSPTTDDTYYFDDITFVGEGGGGGNDTRPMTAAPSPTRAADDVVSLFSDVYNDRPVDTYLTEWSDASLEQIQLEGNNTLQYVGLNFAGIEMTGDNSLDLMAANVTHLHLDVWTANMETFRVKLVDWAGDGFGGQGSNDTEAELSFMPAQGEWVSLDIPLNDFAGMNMTDINQFIISGAPIGTVYIDNIYFFNDAVSTNTPAVGLLEVFPNPTVDRVTITAPARMESVRVFSSDGRLVRSFTPRAERFEVDLTGLAPGAYHALVATARGAMTVKLLKR